MAECARALLVIKGLLEQKIAGLVTRMDQCVGEMQADTVAMQVVFVICGVGASELGVVILNEAEVGTFMSSTTVTAVPLAMPMSRRLPPVEGTFCMIFLPKRALLYPL